MHCRASALERFPGRQLASQRLFSVLQPASVYLNGSQHPPISIEGHGRLFCQLISASRHELSEINNPAGLAGRAGLDSQAKEESGGIDPAFASTHSQTDHHYLRQREAFYSAEALRVFARDSVPEGTFSALQNEVLDGVIETCDRRYRDGFERLSYVLTAAGSLHLTASALITVTEQRDRKGICHQLANDDRLIWVKGETL
jgi:hypothetical protein